MAEDVRSEPRPALPEGIARDLLVALGWAAFVAVGIAIGLALGALGSDVGADPEMIVIAAVIAGLGTFVVRLLMIAVRRGFGSAASGGRTGAPARDASGPEDEDESSERRSGGRPSKRPAGKQASDTGTRTAKRPARAKQAPGKRASGSQKSAGSKRSSGRGKKPTPRKRSGGS